MFWAFWEALLSLLFRLIAINTSHKCNEQTSHASQRLRLSVYRSNCGKELFPEVCAIPTARSWTAENEGTTATEQLSGLEDFTHGGCWHSAQRRYGYLSFLFCECHKSSFGSRSFTASTLSSCCRLSFVLCYVVPNFARCRRGLQGPWLQADPVGGLHLQKVGLRGRRFPPATSGATKRRLYMTMWTVQPQQEVQTWHWPPGIDKVLHKAQSLKQDRP